MADTTTDTTNAGTGRGLASRLPSQGPVRVAIMGGIGLSSILVLWQAICVVFAVPEYLVPTPVAVFKAMGKDWALLLDNAVPTITEAFFGFIIGNTIAILVAIAFVYNKVIEEMYYPVAILIKTIPIVAIAPVLKLILGNGIEPKIAVAALICFFPTLVNAVRGFRAVSPNLLELMHVLSASKTEVFRYVRIYGALPYVFSALKISVTMCVLGAIVGEWIGANKGIGYILIQSMFDFDAPRLFATILTASVIAITGFAIVSAVEKAIITWDPGESV
ncbi:ABC transporter permease [Microbulbifer sp. S227A]|uniref:ABC transporter permease n=1 Tax=Microbulbifer sp. S227A TaxID=3415131 RepID=UPI003C7C34A9